MKQSEQFEFDKIIILVGRRTDFYEYNLNIVQLQVGFTFFPFNFFLIRD